jgi:hypothetical protein
MFTLKTGNCIQRIHNKGLKKKEGYLTHLQTNVFNPHYYLLGALGSIGV